MLCFLCQCDLIWFCQWDDMLVGRIVTTKRKTKDHECRKRTGRCSFYPLFIWKFQSLGYIQLLKTWIIFGFVVLLSVFFLSLMLSHPSCNTKTDVKYCLVLTKLESQDRNILKIQYLLYLTARGMNTPVPFPFSHEFTCQTGPSKSFPLVSCGRRSVCRPSAPSFAAIMELGIPVSGSCSTSSSSYAVKSRMICFLISA